MKIILILILLLFGACSEKPEKVVYVSLIRGNETIKKNIKYIEPKIGNKDILGHEIYKIVKENNEKGKVLFYNTIYSISGEIFIYEYQKYFNSIFLIKKSGFRTNYIKKSQHFIYKDKVNFTLYVPFDTITKELNFRFLNEEESYYYECLKQNEYKYIYYRELYYDSKRAKRYYVLFINDLKDKTKTGTIVTDQKLRYLSSKYKRDYNKAKESFNLRNNDYLFYKDSIIIIYNKLNINTKFNFPYYE